MRTRSSPTRALTDDGDIWWEGMTDEPPAHAIDWHGNDWTPESEAPAAHPNARFTVAADQAPSIADEWEDPAGVPIDAFLFGGRRATRRAARPRGVRLGARRVPRLDDVLGDDRRRVRHGRPAPLRPLRDAARSAATTWPTTSSTGSTSARAGDADKLPRIFYVNWFRKDDDGKFLWPGFGENSRVLEWVFRRCNGESEAVETPIGLRPGRGRAEPRGPRRLAPRRWPS